MEPSPLTLQIRPEIFQPKIVKLYEALFQEHDEDWHPSEGFWQEFFLLKPDAANLRRILAVLSADDLLHLQTHTQDLFLRAVSRIRSGTAPSDEFALDTLTAFLGSALNKRYISPSSDVISVLAGLDYADVVLPDFVGALDTVVRNGRTVPLRLKAVRVALSMTSGAYQTGLLSYFTHRDLFPSLMKLVHDSETQSQAMEPFILLGLLANYNRFEFQNPYRLRFDDFVNDDSLKKLVRCVGVTSCAARDKYIAVQDDAPEGWTLSNTLSYLGLGILTPSSRPSTPVSGAEEARAQFTALPGPEAAILLSTYDFVHANKLFCYNLVTLPPENKNETSPFSGFLSMSSYLFQHAYRSTRASFYTYVNLFILQVLVEDQALVKRMCSDESKTIVRLCRQRQPYLPQVRGERAVISVILDIVIDGINHNLRRRLDMDFYILCLGILLRIISFLGRSRTRLAYHWSELWRSVLSFIRFLTTYASDLRAMSGIDALVDSVVNIIAFSLTAGEAFLPDTGSYDDLFYKLIETGDVLVKFRDSYDLNKRKTSNAIDVLTGVSSHYYALLEGDEKGRTKSKNLSPREVQKVIKQGYETLSIQTKEGLDRWEPFREADHRTVLKRVARIAVEDAKALIEDR